MIIHTTYAVTGQDGTSYGTHDALDENHAIAMAGSCLEPEILDGLTATEVADTELDRGEALARCSPPPVARDCSGAKVAIGDRVRSTAPGYTDIAGRVTAIEFIEGRAGAVIPFVAISTDSGHETRGQAELYRLEPLRP
jgi:hypothetical protein